MRLVILLVIFSIIVVGVAHADNENTKTLAYDHKFLATPDCTTIPSTSQYWQGLLTQDGIIGKDADKIKQFIFKIEQDSNSHNITMKMNALDQQNKTIPHVSFFLNVTKQNQTKLLFHTHSGLLTLQINQTNNQADWTPMAEQEPYAGGFTTPDDIIPVSIPVLDGKYHTDIEIFGAFNDRNIFIPNCVPKFNSEFSVKDGIISDVSQVIEQTSDNKTESQATISKIKQICNDSTEINCLQATDVLNPALTIPFKKSDTVLVGKIIEAEPIPDQNKTKYSISVEKYLRNPKPNDLIVAIGNSIASKEPLIYSELEFYNSPIFEKGDTVFVYLKNNDGMYDILPYSFGIDKSRIPFRGPPPEHVLFTLAKPEYSIGEPIIISGKMQKGNLFSSAVYYNANSTIGIKISGPGNSPYLSDKLDVDENGQFQYDLKIKPDAKAGSYNYMVTAGFSGTGSSFQYITSPLKQLKIGIKVDKIQCKDGKSLVIKNNNKPACLKPASMLKLVERKLITTGPVLTYHLETPSKTSDLTYFISSGNIANIRADIVSYSLVITLEDNAKNGIMAIAIPRDLVDAKMGYLNQKNVPDDAFFVLADGQETDFDETKTDVDRTVTIMFKENTKKIEIIGSHFI